MKVKAIKTYYDLELKKVITDKDPEFEVSEARAKELSGYKNKAGYPLVEIVKTTATTNKGGKKKKEA